MDVPVASNTIDLADPAWFQRWVNFRRLSQADPGRHAVGGARQGARCVGALGGRGQSSELVDSRLSYSFQTRFEDEEIGVANMLLRKTKVSSLLYTINGLT